MEERLELVGAAAESSYDGKLAMRGLPLSSAPIPWQKSWWEASAMPPPSKTTKSRSPPILTAGGLFHTACDTHTDKGICCSEPAPPACLTLAAVQTRARKAGRVRSERPLSGMVVFPHSRASGASASLVDSAARRGWLRQEKGAKSGAKGRPGSSHGTIFFFSPLRKERRVGGLENFGALGGGPAAPLRLRSLRPPLGPSKPELLQSANARRCRSYFSDLVLFGSVPAW